MQGNGKKQTIGPQVFHYHHFFGVLFLSRAQCDEIAPMYAIAVLVDLLHCVRVCGGGEKL